LFGKPSTPSVEILAVKSHQRLLLAFAMAYSTAVFVTADAEDSSVPQWPATVDGKYVPKTFRFKPSYIEFRRLPTRARSTLVVFGIKQDDIPADYFSVYYRNGSDKEKRIKRAIDEDSGYITVVATYVGTPTPKDQWRGVEAYSVEGRGLQAVLKLKPLKPNK
jgi:hypothetical protein